LSSSSLQQYYNVQPAAAPYAVDVQRPNEPFKSQIASQSAPKSNLNVREFLATWDEGEEEVGEKPSETTAPIVVLDCMTLEGDALTKVQEKLNVVSYENLEKVLKDNQNSLVINTETNENDSIHNKAKPPSKLNFEPLDYTKRETGIIKPFISERKTSPGPNNQSEKNYSVNFDGMVAWYGKKNTDISSTDLIERLADRIFNLSKSQENEGVSFGTASYTGQITQTNNRSIESSMKDSSKYVQSQEMFDLQHRAGKCLELSVINKIDCNNDAVPRNHSRGSNESNKMSSIKSNSINSSCIVENTTKKCLNISNEETTPWNLDQGSQEQHLNMSLYDHSVIMKPLDFSSLTDETKGNPFVFEKNTSNSVKPSDGIINDQYNKVFNENNNYNSTVSNSQHAVHHQTDSSNRNFPVIVSPHVHRQEYNGFHESVIQRTGCDKSKQHDKVSTAQPDFENMNWNISNDLDKIMKHTNIAMEPSCLYDSRSHYSNMLDNMNSDKTVSTQWKDNVPVNSKINSTNHDSFFDGWNFIESYENHSSRKTSNKNNNNNNEVHNPLFLNQMTSVGESNNKNRDNNRFGEKVKNEMSVTLKDTSFSKPINMSNNNNTHSRSVFNLNSRIPDFSDGFELSVINNEPHEYMQFKKLSNDNEHRTDGSIFEHLTEPKCIRTTAGEAANVKNDHNNKLDVVGLPSFKEKEPLAPMPVPPKLNVVKPIIRDPSQIYSVIKQKLKYDNPCVENDNAASHKTGGHILRGDHTNVYNGTDLKSKYNNVQLNQFDVWSEKFVLKGNSDNTSSAVVQCDVEITQFKSTPENRNALIPKPNTGENYQDKNEKLPENTNCNLIADKMNVVESDDKINSNDFLNCLENSKTNDQKYRDTLDEFETSFGFDIHCNNESNKSFHEDIVDKCLEETIKDKIGEHNINTSDSTNNNTSKGNTTSSDNNNSLPFQCNFQSSYLIKNYFDENKNKTIAALEQKQNSIHEKANFNYHGDIENEFELQNNKNVHATHNSDKNSNFNIINDINCDVVNRSKHDTGENNSNFINQTKLKYSFESCNENNDSKISSREKNRFDYLTIEHRNFEFENNKKNILKSTNCKEIIMNNNHSNVHDLSNIQKQSSVDFENINNSANIFETNSNTSPESTIETNENRELQNNKIGFESTLRSENTGNVKHRINNKNNFEVENNNSDLYQTQNLEKIHEFDFETRIIQNFEMECSNSNVQKPASQIEICTNTNQKNTKYGYERNDTENKIQKEINFNSPLSIHKESQIKKSSDVDCTDNTQFNNVVKTENKKNKIDSIFEVINTEQEKLNLEIRYTDLDTQNDNTEKINFNNRNNEISNTNINAEIENIFENLFDNLKTSNIEKDSNLFRNKSDDKCNVSKSLEIITDQNVQINNSSILRNDCKKSKCYNVSDEAFKETSNVVLLQEFVNNSTSRLMPISSLQNKMPEEKNYNELTLDKFDVQGSVKHIQKKNENYLYVPKNTSVYKDIVAFKEKTIEYIKQNEKEIINQNNVQTAKNMTSNIVQGYTENKMSENIKSDLLTVKTTDKPLDEGFRQNYSTGPVSFNNFEQTRQEHSKDLVEVEDSSSSDSSSLDHFESVHQEYLNEFSEFEDSSSSESSSLKYMKFKCHQDCKGDVEDSTNSGTSLVNHVISKHQEHSNEMIEENSINSEPTSLNNVGFTCKHDSEDIVEVENTTSSPNHIGSTHQEHFNEMVEAKDLSNSDTSSLNDVEFTHQKDSNDIGDVDDSTSSESNSLNHVKPTYQEHYNDMIDADDSINSEPNSLNEIKFTEQQICKDVNVEDSTSSGSSPLNYVNSTHQEYFNEIMEKDSINSEPTSLNDVEFTCEHESEDIVEVENTTFSPNHIGSTCQAHFNKMIEANDLSNSETSSLNDVEFTRQKDSTDIGDVDDSTSSESNLLNHVKPTYQEHYNDMIDADDSINSEPNSLNDIKFTGQINCKDVNVEDSTSSGSSPLNYVNSTHQEHFNEIMEKDSINSEPTSLNDVEFTREQNSENIVEDKGTTGSLNHVEPTHQEHYNEIIEAVHFKPILDNVELTSQQHLNKIVDCSTSESLALSKNDILQTNSDSYFRNIDSENIIDDVKLPKVKFTLKCRTKGVIRKNVFDEESTVPYKKRNAVNGEKLITRNMFKRQNNSYKPWQSAYRKQWSSDDPKESAKTVAVHETASSPGDTVRNVGFDGEETDCADRRGVVISPAESVAFAADERQRRDEQPNAVETGENNADDPYERPFARDDDHTPMPSPFDEFGSEAQTLEYGDGVVFWDKSLEDEYKNVLHKTISKLAKAYVCGVRDKFNTRLLARRTNATRLKKRRWRRQQRRRQRLVDGATKTRVVVVGDDCCGLDDGEPTAVNVPAATKYKIKVQLPWGRIFNLNNREDLDRNGETSSSRGTKLVLGPAKVEVRLSRTPGKWHVAACESMTSPKSVVSVRRLVLQRAPSPARDYKHGGRDVFDGSVGDNNSGRAASSSSAAGDGVGERSRKLPKIVIRRNGRDNHYTSYVRSGGGFEGDEDDGSPRLMVRLVRNRKLDAMAADGVTTLDLKHFSPIAESASTTTTTTADTYGPKRVRYE